MTDVIARLEALARRRVLVIVALIGVLAVPLVVALVGVRRPTWFPASDFAQAELHIRAVPRHLPLVGAAGRLGTIFEQGSHPGPAAAISLAGPYRLFGASSWSVMVAVVLLHLAAITGALVACRRTAGNLAMALLAAIVAVMIHSLGVTWFLEPWNPWYGVFVLLAAVMCAWGAWSGDLALFPWFVVAGSYCAQVHIGYAPVIGGLLVALAIVIVHTRRRAPDISLRPIAVGAVIGAVLSLPPIIDQLTRDPGNLTVLWRQFTNPPEPSAGWRRTMSAVVNELNLFGSWSSGANTHPSDAPTIVQWIGFIGLACLVVAAVVVAWRRRDRIVLRAFGLAAVVVALSVLTVSRIFGPVSDYLVRWLATVAALLVLLAAWSFARATTRRQLVVIGVGAIAAVSVVASIDPGASSPSPGDSEVLAALSPDLLAATRPGTNYLMRFQDPVALGGYGFGVMLDLERHGRTVLADSWLKAAVLPQRTIAPDAVDTAIDTIVWVVTGDAAIDEAVARPGAELVARTDPRTPDEVRQSDALRSSIEQQLIALGRPDLVARLDEQYGVSQVIAEPGLDASLVDDLEEYRALRLPTAVVLVPVPESS